MLIIMCLHVGLFVFNLFGTLCFLDLCVIFLHQIGTSSVIISSKMFLISCSLSSPSGILRMRMLLYFVLSKIVLKQSSFFKFSFLFAALPGWFYYLVFQITDLILCFIQPTVYSFQCIIYFRYCILYFRLVLFYGFYAFSCC